MSRGDAFRTISDRDFFNSMEGWLTTLIHAERRRLLAACKDIRRVIAQGRTWLKSSMNCDRCFP